MCCENILAEVRNAGKSYQIYSTPARRLLQTLCMGRKQFYSTFQALEQVSFTVKRGECLGIIGRNGAGKSTLLQLLCGTLEPTCGEIVLHGKISALLELGFGFNPDFTGRDNIFLSGLIHGLSREQIAERLEDIIRFAEIGDFIDQPVKQYSSGMFVRLAFAVAAHVESEILLIDEALAVGDIFFQQKCYRYLEEQRARKAVILVSHDLNAIASLCSRIIVLDKGRVAFAGAVNEGIECYTHLLYPGEVSAAAKEIPAEMYPVPPEKCTGNGGRVTGYGISVNQSPSNICKPGDLLEITASFALNRRCENPIIGFFFSDKFGRRVFGNCRQLPHGLMPGNGRISFVIRWPEVAPQEYTLTLGIGDGRDIMAQKVCCWATDFYVVSSIMPLGIVHGVFNVEMNHFEIKEVE